MAMQQPRERGRATGWSRRAFLRATALAGVAAGLGARARTLHAASLPAPATRQIGPAERLRVPTVAPAAARAFDGLLARLDAAAGWRPYFMLDLDAAPPALVHSYWDGVDMAGRTVDALLRLRPLLGASDGGEGEHGVRAYLLGRQGRQGLFYNEDDDPAGVLVDTFCQSRALLGLTTWLAHVGDAEVEGRIEACIAGLAAIAARDGEYRFLPGQRWRDGWLDQALLGRAAHDGRDNLGYSAQCALPLLEYHALTGSPAALDLAARLLRHFVERSGQVDPEGHFAGETHASGYLPMAAAAVRYAAASGDERYLRWAERLYRWVRANSSAFGWVPGPLGLDASYFTAWYAAPQRRTCETCSLADAIELASLLARAGYPEYWDDVERFARNQLLENQFGASGALADVPAPAERAVAVALDGAWETFALPYRLLARPDGRRLVEGCCSAAGARALSLVWEHALEWVDDTLTVHLGISRPCPWAEVVSHEPLAGQLDVTLRQAATVRLRVPSWARGSARLYVDDAPVAAEQEGDYVAAAAAAGSRVSLRYALVEHEEGFAVNDETTLAYWRGGTVLDVLPDADPAPIYQRHLAKAVGAAP